MEVIFLTADNQPIVYPNQCVCGIDTEYNYHCIMVKDILTYNPSYKKSVLVIDWFSTRQKAIEDFEIKKLAHIARIKAIEVNFTKQ